MKQPENSSYDSGRYEKIFSELNAFCRPRLNWSFAGAEVGLTGIADKSVPTPVQSTDDGGVSSVSSIGYQLISRMERVAQDVAEFLKKVQQGKVEEVKEALGNDKSLAAKEDASGRIALHFAAYTGDLAMATLLVELGSTIDATDFDGNTPLNLAVKRGNKQIIEFLVASGSNINYSSSRGATPLHHAAASGNIDVIELLITLGSHVSQEPTEVGSALHWAAHSGEIPPVAYFLDVLGLPIELIDANQGTVLHTAAAFGFADLVLFLLERGANANKVARGGSTPLHVSVETTPNKEVIKQLVVFGAVDTPDADGLTAEATAEQKGCSDVFKEGIKMAGSHKISDQAKLEKMEQFKQQGNKVFQAGEYSKGSKFYSLAISFQPSNHVLFSNRSACFYNLKQYHRAFADACHCVNLKPDWPKGYFRKAASLVSLGKFEIAKKTFEAGLQIDPKNGDLVNGLKDLLKKAPQVA